MRLFEEIGGKVQEITESAEQNKKSTFRAFASRAKKQDSTSTIFVQPFKV